MRSAAAEKRVAREFYKELRTCYYKKKSKAPPTSSFWSFGTVVGTTGSGLLSDFLTRISRQTNIF